MQTNQTLKPSNIRFELNFDTGAPALGAEFYGAEELVDLRVYNFSEDSDVQVLSFQAADIFWLMAAMQGIVDAAGLVEAEPEEDATEEEGDDMQRLADGG